MNAHALAAVVTLVLLPAALALVARTVAARAGNVLDLLAAGALLVGLGRVLASFGGPVWSHAATLIDPPPFAIGWTLEPRRLMPLTGLATLAVGAAAAEVVLPPRSGEAAEPPAGRRAGGLAALAIVAVSPDAGTALAGLVLSLLVAGRSPVPAVLAGLGLAADLPWLQGAGMALAVLPADGAVREHLHAVAWGPVPATLLLAATWPVAGPVALALLALAPVVAVGAVALPDRGSPAAPAGVVGGWALVALATSAASPATAAWAAGTLGVSGGLFLLGRSLAASPGALPGVVATWLGRLALLLGVGLPPFLGAHLPTLAWSASGGPHLLLGLATVALAAAWVVAGTAALAVPAAPAPGRRVAVPAVLASATFVAFDLGFRLQAYWYVARESRDAPTSGVVPASALVLLGAVLGLLVSARRLR